MRPHLLPRVTVTVGLALLTGLSAARADHLVILKDGFTLRGFVRRQTTVAFDPSAGLVEMARLNGFFMVEDGCRRVIFSHRQVNDDGVEEKEFNADIVRLTRQVINL